MLPSKREGSVSGYTGPCFCLHQVFSQWGSGEVTTTYTKKPANDQSEFDFQAVKTSKVIEKLFQIIASRWRKLF